MQTAKRCDSRSNVIAEAVRTRNDRTLRSPKSQLQKAAPEGSGRPAGRLARSLQELLEG